MRVDIIKWDEVAGWSFDEKSIDNNEKAQLVIFFGSPNFYKKNIGTDFLHKSYPNAQIIGCSTGGEILQSEVMDDSLVACAIKFQKSTVKLSHIDLKDGVTSEEAGQRLVHSLLKDDLRHIYVLSDGTKVNGSELVKGMLKELPPGVTITGGLAGDGADFFQTYITINGKTDSQVIGAIGFYGNAIKIGYGSGGGWDAFGPERIITKSKGNILFELDNRPALELYKLYLGEEADALPSSGLLYPLNIREDRKSKHELVRTIVGIDEENQSLIFAGDIPEGYISRLMKGNLNNLVEGAEQAANIAILGNTSSNCLALSVSCIGRKLLLGQRISDETEAIAQAFDNQIPTIGFYSYGEICHHSFSNKCDLHNQTMTITYVCETV